MWKGVKKERTNDKQGKDQYKSIDSKKNPLSNKVQFGNIGKNDSDTFSRLA